MQHRRCYYERPIFRLDLKLFGFDMFNFRTLILMTFVFSPALLLSGCFSSSVSDNMTLQEKYNTACGTCHTEGRFGSPRSFDANIWNALLNQRSPAELLTSVQEGRGFMPQDGGCTNCTQEDLEALIKYMSSPQP